VPLAALAPGSVVVVRDEEWLVTAAEQTIDGWRLDVVGLSELVRETSATFYTGRDGDLDTVELLDPRQARLVRMPPPGTAAPGCGWRRRCAAPRCPSGSRG